MKKSTNIQWLVALSLVISLTFFAACSSDENEEIVEQIEEEEIDDESTVDISVLASKFYYNATVFVIVTNMELL